MRSHEKNEEIIFKAAIKLESPAKRAAYVKQACGSDADLVARLGVLLRAYDDAGEFLETPPLAGNVLLDESPIAEGPGTVIGRYKLLERIGEGGMAVVYMAEQERPIRRRVALKIIKLGMDTKSVIARFEAERQALAMMDHPHIAKVFDAGATKTGRPYFVMELVTGVSITEYCDKNQLGTKERLGLFIQVCHAVQHAHQKGIIHRDIKPSNVLVTTHDGTAVPKVIDFGIAKATNQRLTEKTLFTRYAHIIGTPAYMSPEQAELSDVDVDTCSDIYSLGVLLYELLTGTTPFGEEALRQAGYVEMQRIIREEEPVRPSTKLMTLGETLADVAQQRGCTPDLLARAVRGDLDWIVMKTLEKSRDRRYDTVSALALDVRRHLADQPILARAPSAAYGLRKFLRRHRPHALLALTVSLLSLAVIIILLLWNHSRLQSSRTESKSHKRKLYQTYVSLAKGDHAAAIEIVRSILKSKHVGREAQFFYDSILANARERVAYYSGRIEADPEDAESHLHRAQYHYCQQDKEAVLADMNTYAAILNPSAETDSGNSWFRNLLVDSWGNRPTNLGPTVNSLFCDAGPCLSADGLELYFCSLRADGVGSHSGWIFDAFDMWVATRATIDDDWGTPANLGPTINSTTADGSLCMSFDGRSLFFESARTGGYGGMDIWVTTRPSVLGSWAAPTNLGRTVNSPALDMGASISSDGLTLFFQSNRPGGCGETDIWFTTRVTTDNDWGAPKNLGPTVNSATFDGHPCIAPDGVALLFCSNRPGGYGDWDIWVTTRATTDSDWRTPMNLGPTINTSAGEAEPYIAPDGRVLYFSDWLAPRPGGVGNVDLWRVSIGRVSSE